MERKLLRNLLATSCRVGLAHANFTLIWPLQARNGSIRFAGRKYRLLLTINDTRKNVSALSTRNPKAASSIAEGSAQEALAGGTGFFNSRLLTSWAAETQAWLSAVKFLRFRV